VRLLGLPGPGGGSGRIAVLLDNPDAVAGAGRAMLTELSAMERRRAVPDDRVCSATPMRAKRGGAAGGRTRRSQRQAAGGGPVLI